ncbi:PQQ-dependent sugar dehydrogenase [Chloroflexota bacterium]
MTSIEPFPIDTATESPVRSFPNMEMYFWKLISNEFSQPVDLTNANDGSERIFVVEKEGIIQVVTKDGIRPIPFMDIRGKVNSSGYEQGLLSAAFHPEFPENGYLFAYYIDKNGNTVVSRFSANPATPIDQQSIDPDSELIILQVKQPFGNHNGGQLAFGPDRMLWIGLGDGGSGGDPYGNGQSVQTMLGKILRIDVDQGNPYGIPLDNPFLSGGGLPEIWAYGLRNPWKFSFDSQTGDLYIADVGQNQWEEINFLPAGFSQLPVNFGWNLREGQHDYQDGSLATSNILVEPIQEYAHDQGCSVTGGYVYHGYGLPELDGVYFFGDFCSGLVWGLINKGNDQWDGRVVFETGLSISSFGVDEIGEIYLLDLNGGLYRLEKTN